MSLYTDRSLVKGKNTVTVYCMGIKFIYNYKFYKGDISKFNSHSVLYLGTHNLCVITQGYTDKVPQI